MNSINESVKADNVNQADSSYVCYNEIISICMLTENYYTGENNLFLARSNMIDEHIEYKFCTMNKDLIILKETLFIISKINIDSLSSNTENSKLEFNEKFTLNHYISNKYLSLTKNLYTGNYELSLVVNQENASSFFFKKIYNLKKDIHNIDNFINYSDSTYLCTFISEKGQVYYLNKPTGAYKILSRNENADDRDNSIQINKDTINNEKVNFSTSNFTKILIINQNRFKNFDSKTKDKKQIHSSDIVNIVFSLETVYYIGVKIKNQEKFQLKKNNNFSITSKIKSLNNQEISNLSMNKVSKKSKEKDNSNFINLNNKSKFKNKHN